MRSPAKILSRSALGMQQGQVRISVLVIALICVGLAIGTFIYFLKGKDQSAAESATPESALSSGTMAVLENLQAPVNVSFYAILDPASVSEPVRAFAERVDQLLAEYEREGAGKVTVSRFNSVSDANAASADGIRPFNMDKGDACFLGITITQNNRKESMPQLSPEWEQALEADLSRAIARVSAVKPPITATANSATAQPDFAAIDQVKRMIPNVASVSLEEGKRLLREAALKDFKVAVDEMQNQMGQAQQRLSEAQKSKSGAEQQAAMKELQRIQATQTEKLKDIAARTQAQIEALERMKEPTSPK